MCINIYLRLLWYLILFMESSQCMYLLLILATTYFIYHLMHMDTFLGDSPHIALLTSPRGALNVTNDTDIFCPFHRVLSILPSPSYIAPSSSLFTPPAQIIPSPLSRSPNPTPTLPHSFEFRRSHEHLLSLSSPALPLSISTP